MNNNLACWFGLKSPISVVRGLSRKMLHQNLLSSGFSLFLDIPLLSPPPPGPPPATKYSHCACIYSNNKEKLGEGSVIKIQGQNLCFAHATRGQGIPALICI